MALDKRWATLVENREDPGVAVVCQQHHIWAFRLELDGPAIPWNSSIREFQRGHSSYVAEALKQPLFLPKNMADLRHMWQPDLFMSLKRDLDLIGSQSYLLVQVLSCPSCLFYYYYFITPIYFFNMVFSSYFCTGYLGSFCSRGMGQGHSK